MHLKGQHGFDGDCSAVEWIKFLIQGAGGNLTPDIVESLWPHDQMCLAVAGILTEDGEINQERFQVALKIWRYQPDVSIEALTEAIDRVLRQDHPSTDQSWWDRFRQIFGATLPESTLLPAATSVVDGDSHLSEFLGTKPHDREFGTGELHPFRRTPHAGGK